MDDPPPIMVSKSGHTGSTSFYGLKTDSKHIIFVIDVSGSMGEQGGVDEQGKFRVDIAPGDHPVTRGMKPFETDDELYTCLDGDAAITVLATAVSKVDGQTYGTLNFSSPYPRKRKFFDSDIHALELMAMWVEGELSNPPVSGQNKALADNR